MARLVERGLRRTVGVPGLFATAYSFGAMLSFTTAHVSIVALRIKRPDIERPYRIGWNVHYKGALIPIPAVLGAIGTFVAWCSVLALHTEARTVGMGWMVIGCIGYIVYRRRSGLDLFSRHRIEHAQAPDGFVPLAYLSALVPIFGDDVSGGAIRRAAKLLGEDAEILCVYVVTIPTQLPLEAPMAAEQRDGLAVLEAARIAGRKSGLKVHTRLVHAGSSSSRPRRRGTARASGSRRDQAPAALGARPRSAATAPIASPIAAAS